MDYSDKLKELKDCLQTIKEARHKCIGFSEYGQEFYYALSGMDGLNSTPDVDIESEVQTILGTKNTFRCKINDSFTILLNIPYPNLFTHNHNGKINRILLDFYKYKEDIIYHNLINNNSTHIYFPEYIQKRIKFEDYYLSGGQNNTFRNYSCVERKIIGCLKRKKPTIYVSSNPCYICLPTLYEVTFISWKKYDFRIFTMKVSKAKAGLNNEFEAKIIKK